MGEKDVKLCCGNGVILLVQCGKALLRSPAQGTILGPAVGDELAHVFGRVMWEVGQIWADAIENLPFQLMLVFQRVEWPLGNAKKREMMKV